MAVETKSGENRKDLVEPYGKYVRLTPEEMSKLREKFGTEKAAEMIQRMNDYIGEDPKRQKKYESRNHYLTLLNWERMDQERKTQPFMQQKPQATFVKPEPKKTYDFTDVLEMRKQKQEKEVIDL